jgi:hypothetical protein
MGLMKECEELTSISLKQQWFLLTESVPNQLNNPTTNQHHNDWICIKNEETCMTRSNKPPLN